MTAASRPRSPSSSGQRDQQGDGDRGAARGRQVVRPGRQRGLQGGGITRSIVAEAQRPIRSTSGTARADTAAPAHSRRRRRQSVILPSHLDSAVD